jgi:hypothetical protein
MTTEQRVYKAMPLVSAKEFERRENILSAGADKLYS